MASAIDTARHVESEASPPVRAGRSARRESPSGSGLATHFESWGFMGRSKLSVVAKLRRRGLSTAARTSTRPAWCSTSASPGSRCSRSPGWRSCSARSSAATSRRCPAPGPGGRGSPDVPLHFTAFHPDYKLNDLPATPAATLTRARAIARGEGLQYVYTGNVHDNEGGTTYCPGCAGALVVRLDGRRVGVALLKLADPSVAECWNRDRDARRARGQPALGGRELATRSSHQLASSSCETPCCDTGRASRLLLRPEACRQEAPRRGARQQLIPSKMDQRNELPPLPLNRHGYRARATQNPR